MPLDTFAARLAAERHDRSWSQAELSRRSGIAQSAICRLEQGRGMPTLSTALALAAALEIDYARLCGAAVHPAPWAVVRGTGNERSVVGWFAAKKDALTYCRICQDSPSGESWNFRVEFLGAKPPKEKT